MTEPGSPAAWLAAYSADLRTALDRAAQDRFRAVFASATPGGLDQADFSRSACRHLRRYLRDLGLTLAGVSLEQPGGGLTDPLWTEQRLTQLRGTLELCRELGVPLLTTDLTGLGEEQHAPRLSAVLREVADASDRCGIITAIRDPAGLTSPAEAAVRSLGCPTLKLAADTAQGLPPEQLRSVADQLGAVYLRDVRRSGGRFQEVAYGTGEVDFPALLAALESGGCPGALVLRRDTPGGVDALRQGRDYMRSLAGRGRDR